MNFRPVGLGLVAAACVTAAAGSAFVAVRQNQSDRPLASVTATPVSGRPAGAGSGPVRETAALVDPAATAPAVPAGPPAKVLPAEAPAAGAPTSQKLQRRDTSRPASARTEKATGPSIGQGPAAVTSARNAEAGNGAPAAPATPARDDAPFTQPPSTDTAAIEPPAALEPVAARAESKFVEVVIPASAVIGLQIDRPVSSETARIEDRIEARVTRDVMAGGRRAIPAGSRMIGSVVLVERGGKVKEQARLGVRFHTLVLANGMEMPIRTDSILRVGEPPSAESARKIAGAAAGGAILGAILGGGKGAVIGGATGAAGGTAAVMTGGRNAATLSAGAIVTARVAEPITMQVEKE